MAMSAVPFALQDVTHNANLFRQAVASLVPPGGGVVTPGDFKVTQTATASMSIIVGVGRIWIPGSEIANVTGGNFSSQSMYYAQNESADTRTVSVADPTNPRIDVVYAYVRDQFYSGSQNMTDYAIQTGVPTPGASYPANAPGLPNDAVALAWIYVAAGASQIVNANITQLAVPFTMRHMEWTATTPTQTAGSGTNFGTLGADAANTYNGGFASGGANGQITLSAGGVYVVESKVSPTASYSALQLWATDSGGSYHLAQTATGYGGLPATGTFLFAGAAGAVLNFGATWNVTSNASARVKMTKIG